MKIVVIDAQGGGLGKQLIVGIKDSIKDAKIFAVGTNSTATSAMLKAGADIAATGENAVVVNARDADIIVGPIGIIIADAMYGEVTSTIANAVSSSNAKKILIPFNQYEIFIVGVEETNIKTYIQKAIDQILKCVNEQ